MEPSLPSSPGTPSLESQQQFWNSWNGEWRFRDDRDAFMERQREVAIATARRSALTGARILEVGGGTGWLGNALLPFGSVLSTDLSPAAVAEGRLRHPGVEFVCGDFLTVDLPGSFDFVVSADSLIHMHDRDACVRRIAGLLRPGGIFLLMTQNRAVWRRRSKLRALGIGQIEEWTPFRRYLTMLRPSFRIERLSSIVPGGDRGLLWWVENRYVRGGLGRLVGRQRWQGLLERALLGRELVFVCRRR
jgi:SAM-dependent methyltransferase